MKIQLTMTSVNVNNLEPGEQTLKPHKCGNELVISAIYTLTGKKEKLTICSF